MKIIFRHYISLLTLMSLFLLDLGSADAEPLHDAAMNGNIDQVKQLVKEADVNPIDESGYTPLHWAADKGHKQVAEFLVAQGADVNARDDDDRTLLYPASLLTDTSSHVEIPCSFRMGINEMGSFPGR